MSGTYRVFVVWEKREYKDGGWTGKIDKEEICANGFISEDFEESKEVFKKVSDYMKEISND